MEMNEVQFRQILEVLHMQASAMRRIAGSLETLEAIAQAEHEASDIGDTGPAVDLSGRPV